MGKVARQVVEQAGVNVDVLLDKLVRAAGAEFTTFYYYTILRVNAIGFDGEGLKEIIEDARIEDRNHFEALTPRIYELGGALPRDMKAMLNVLVEAERCAVRTYTEICNMTFGKDHRTFEIALAILNEEVEHESWFSEYLSEGPSGHFRRGAPGTSPHVRRFMSADIG